MVLEKIPSLIKRTKLQNHVNEQLSTGVLPAPRSRTPAPSDQRPGTRCQKPVHGFTLLEVMVALAIMSIVLVSVYRMHSQSIAMNMTARFYTHAPLLAQFKLAQLEAESDDDLSGDSGDFGEDFPGYSWQVAVNEVSSEALGDIANDLVRVDVTVSLNEDEYSYSLRTYRFLRE